jgi:transposase
MRAEWRELDRRIEAFDDEFAARARTDGPARLLATFPGIGVLNATALTAAIGDAQTFRRGRDLAARDGLLAVVLAGMDRSLLRSMAGAGAEADDDRRQATAAGISKRGNVYLRKLIIHGARAALPTLSKGETPLGSWLRGLLARAHANKVVVALAARLARSPGPCCAAASHSP